MGRFEGKIAIVTGASAGIGAATVKVLIEAGLKVVGFARRKERIEELAKTIKGAAGKLYAVRVDITKEEDILQGFKWVSDNVGPVSVLVNNAGINLRTELIDGDTEKWRKLLDTNVLGLTIASREAIKVMRANNIDGHIINVNSIAGHKVSNYPGLNLYPASKYAVTALTETLRYELIPLESKIKVSSVSPGFVETEFLEALGITMEEVKALIKYKPLNGEDVANSIRYVLDTPPHVQITELTIQPVGETL